MLVLPDEITGTDMFCGAGGFTTGAKRAYRNMKMRYALNHWDRAIQTHSANYPETEHILAEIDETRPEYCGHTTFLLASPECFPAGTLILTKRGLLPIETVQVGDEVLTHRNRWRVVTAVMSKWSETVVVKGRGHNGLELTAAHPIWARHCTYPWNNAYRRNERHLDPPEWKMTGQLNRDYFWAMPKTFGEEALPIPQVGGRGAAFTPEFWWMIGRWLGDGNLRLRINTPREHPPRRPFRLMPAPCEVCGQPALPHKRYPHLAQFYCGKTCKSRAEAISSDRKGSSIQICCAHQEADMLEARLNFAPPEGARAGHGEYRWSRRRMRTATLFDCPHSGLAVWMLEQFGQHADGKRLPTWVLTMPEEWRRALLDGYVSADGNRFRDAIAINTVSRALATGVMLLAASLGFHPVVGTNVRTRYTIEGRSGAMRTLYHVRWSINPERAQAEATENHVWGRIKSINPGQLQAEVFNLSVEEDESYVADGIVVHNCTNHSLAKGAQRKHLNQMRLPLGDEPPLPTEAEIRSRCMMWDPLRWAAKNRYMFIVLENVVDVAFWDEYDEWLRSWKRIDKDLQYEFAILYLNSMFFPPTPQSRDRWYFVAWQKGLRPPQLDYHPKAYCQVCSGVIDAVQSWKRPEHPWGRYGKNRQYVYRCPRCASEVLPYYCPAFNAIEWSFPTQKIGERDKPLAPKTMERIRYGLEKFRGAPFTTQLNKTTTRSFPMLTGVFPTQTGDNGQALIDPSVPFMLSLSHAGSGYVYSLDQSMPTQTARHETGMALPPAFLFGMNHEPRVTEMWEAMDTQTTYDDTAIVQGLSEQYAPFILDHLAEYRPRDLYWALSTMCASGNHQSIIFPPFITELHGTSHAREVTDALSTVCAGGQHHGLVTPPAGALPAWLVSYYNNGQMIQVSHPSPTMTTHDRCGLLTGPSPASAMIDILECGFRMLQPDPEIKRAMAFPETYIVTGTRREQVKLYGNAVTSPVVEWIIRQCLEALAA